MGDLSYVLETLSTDQYKKLFNGKPIYTPAIKNKKNEYTEMLSFENALLKSLLNIMLNKDISITNTSCVQDKIYAQFVISKNDLKFIKYIKDHIDHDVINIKLSLFDDNYIIDMEIKDVKKLLLIKQVIENYLIVNSLTRVDDRKVLKFILKEYQPINEEYIKYISDVNKDEIMYVKEKHRQEEFQFNDYYEAKIEDVLENKISVLDIYNKDSQFKNIPYNNLTIDMKYTMCNRYFQKIFESRLKILQQNLIDQYKILFNINFNKQSQVNLENYGLSGNLPPFDQEIPNIEIFLYGNLDFCKIDNDVAIFNENLCGQVFITFLHEHEHILQRIGFIDPNLKEAIDNFEQINNDDSDYYINNYNNDPAELDANLVSFIRFNNISKKFGINNPDYIIMEKIKNVILNSDKSFNIYENLDITDINDVYKLLNDKLDKSILKYSDCSGKVL